MNSLQGFNGKPQNRTLHDAQQHTGRTHILLSQEVPNVAAASMAGGSSVHHDKLCMPLSLQVMSCWMA